MLMPDIIQCPECGKEVSTVNSRCAGCGRYFPLKAEAAAGAGKPVPANNVIQGGGLKAFSAIGIGALLFIFLTMALYRYIPGRDAVKTPPARANNPAAQAGGSGADKETIPAGAPAPTVMVPLKRSLAEIEKLYANNMQFEGSALIGSGPLAGGTRKIYSTGTAIDELLLKEDRLYKRSLAFNIAEIEGKVSSFCSTVYILALYPTAYDKQYSLETVPDEIRAKAELFGAKCAALRAAGGQAAEQYEVDGDYAFGCVNQDNARLKFEVGSEALSRAEKI